MRVSALAMETPTDHVRDLQWNAQFPVGLANRSNQIPNWVLLSDLLAFPVGSDMTHKGFIAIEECVDNVCANTLLWTVKPVQDHWKDDSCAYARWIGQLSDQLPLVVRR